MAGEPNLKDYSIDFVTFSERFKAMDIQTRKLNFIQEFLKIQSEELVSQFEKLLNKEKSTISDRDLSPMSIEEFNKRSVG